MKFLAVAILASVATISNAYPGGIIHGYQSNVQYDIDYDYFQENGCHGGLGGFGCGSYNIGGNGGGYYGSEAAAPSYVQGPAAGSKQVNGPVEGPNNIQGPSNGPLNLAGPQQGPASIVGPSQGTANIIGATNGGAHIVGAAQAPITYSEGVAVQSGNYEGHGYGGYVGQQIGYHGYGGYKKW